MKRIKLSPYWICQIIGWGGASLYWVFWMVYNENISFFWGFINNFLTVSTAILITHVYYLLAKWKGWHLLDMKPLLPIVMSAIIPLAIAFCFVNLLINYYTYEVYLDKTFTEAIKNNALTVFITGGRLIAIWLLAFHLYHYAKRGAKAETEKAQLEAKAKEAQIQNLKAQLNPHFLFNALNSVKAMILPEPEKARRAVVLLSDVLRNSLNASKKQFVSLEEELQHVQDYLDIEKIRFEERLNIQYDIEEAVLNQQVLPLSMQILAENAIKHGINKRKEGGIIKIAAKISNDQLKVTFINHGQYKPNPNSEGLGLANLEKRLYLHFGKTGILSIENLDAESVIATMKTPIINAESNLFTH